MISIDYDCNYCKHKRKNIDGWKCVCDAFPEGIPLDLILHGKPSELEECNVIMELNLKSGRGNCEGNNTIL